MKASVLLLLILSCLTLAYVHANKKHKRDTQLVTREKECDCGHEIDRQCGKDGVTYRNKCKANCAGIKVACEGKCPCKKKPCLCSAVFDPICGTDGNTYSNDGCAACEGAGVACQGPCPCGSNFAACTCPASYDPVCGKDGKDYGHPCAAGCSGVGVACKGTCPCTEDPDGGNCACIEIYKPVCSTKGKQFDNECKAQCANAKIECDGECPCPKACAQVQCLMDPCDGATCPAYPNAECIADYCGGCNKDFYVEGKIVDCDGPNPGCACPKNLDPVCGGDGKGYNNPCEAKCAGTEVACKGKCPCSTKCLAPVIKCAKDPCDGAKCPAYPDATCVPDYCKGCEAFDFKVNDRIVDCYEQCVCTLQYDPVCGVDGKTYGNACSASCDKVAIACKGECPCVPKCNGVIVQCLVNPCDVEKCPAHPNAECRANYCNGCNAEFFVNGSKVDCEIGLQQCNKQGEECDLHYGLLSKYSGSKRECCGGLNCCRCNLFERGTSLYFDNHGKCLETCTQCKG